MLKPARTEDLNYSHKKREGRQEGKREDGKKNVKGKERQEEEIQMAAE